MDLLDLLCKQHIIILILTKNFDIDVSIVVMNGSVYCILANEQKGAYTNLSEKSQGNGE